MCCFLLCCCHHAQRLKCSDSKLTIVSCGVQPGYFNKVPSVSCLHAKTLNHSLIPVYSLELWLRNTLQVFNAFELMSQQIVVSSKLGNVPFWHAVEGEVGSTEAWGLIGSFSSHRNDVVLWWCLNVAYRHPFQNIKFWSVKQTQSIQHHIGKHSHRHDYWGRMDGVLLGTKA